MHTYSQLEIAPPARVAVGPANKALEPDVVEDAFGTVGKAPSGQAVGFWGGLRPAFKKVLAEPLIHFAVLGAGIFFVADAHEHAVERHRIAVDESTVRKIALTYERQYGVPPQAEQLKVLVDRFIDEEILYREGHSLNLDRDDEIVRRRIVQKYQFLQQDLTVVQPPTDQELTDFYHRNSQKYLIPEKISLSHVYFSPDNGGDAAAEARAESVLATLRAGHAKRAPEAGDSFSDLYDYSAIDEVGLKRLFGASGFAEAVEGAPLHQWSGPYKSGFGWHLIYIEARTPATTAPFEEIKDRLRADYIEQQRQAKNAEVFARLKQKYNIIQYGAADAHAP